MNHFLHTVWEQVNTSQTPPPWWMTVLTLVVTAGLVFPYPVWKYSRNVITIVHEGGHALVATVVGRKLSGISLHSDTSGVTVSAGKPTGLGMILTTFFGYTAPATAGLGAALLLADGRSLLALWVFIGLLILMALLIRNFYGALTVSLTIGAVFVVSWYTPIAVKDVFASMLTSFLLVAAPKPIWELQSKRRRGPTPESDADQLHQLTGIPGTIWVGMFMIVAIFCFVYSTYVLIF